MDSKVLITGSAGFIGFHLSQKLCKDNWNVVGVDNLNDYYDVNLKQARLNILLKYNNFTFIKIDIADKDYVYNLFESEKFDYVINLAAQPGVRYSIKNPYVYIESNIKGFLNVLEGCRHFPIKHLIYASSSSVYGANTNIPFSVHDNILIPACIIFQLPDCGFLPSMDPGAGRIWLISVLQKQSSIKSQLVYLIMAE